jgi:predicted AlkP superfamily pyrophosphatase or phosphodiesterase
MLFALVLVFSTSCATSGPRPITGPVGDPRPDAKPILILVSLDGWRWDYLNQIGAPHLKALAARGIRSEGLIPAFPSKTYPNHYTIVTGLYPEHHGIIANNMLDISISTDRFTMTAATAKDPRWWGGEPMWATAIRQGLKASSMFWPGSETAIGGVRPTDWFPYQDEKPNIDRVNQVLAWLARPEPDRPSFITLYFSDVDTTGHTAGPGAPQTLAEAEGLDRMVGRLAAGISSLGLLEQTTIMAVSDHGMSQQAPDRKIFLDDYLDLRSVDVLDWSPVLQLLPRTESAEALYNRLRGKHPALQVYKKEELPPDLHYSTNRRIAPIVAIADDGWQITTNDRFKETTVERRSGGEHGYDPKLPSMHGLFIAAGPRLKQGLVVPRFENIHIYELMCRILGVQPAKNDGDPAVTAGWMRSSDARTSASRIRQSVQRSIPGS